MKGKIIGVACAAMLGLAAANTSAAAMPNGLAGIQHSSAETEQVRWVCGRWGRCWWRPNYYGYYGGPRFFVGPRWGWGRGWGHRCWRGGGWHRGWRRW